MNYRKNDLLFYDRGEEEVFMNLIQRFLNNFILIGYLNLKFKKLRLKN